MNSSQQNQTPNQPQQPKKSGSNTALIIIIIAIAVIVVSGVGGYFAWKYYLKAKITGTANQTSTTTSSKQLSLKTLEETFQYPGGTQTFTDRSGNTGSVSKMIFETSDSINTAYDYYLALATKKGLTVSKKSLESDNSSGSLTIEGTGYYADINLYKGEKTEIDVLIYGDNIKNDTTNTSTSTSTSATTPTSTNSSAKTTISDDYVISDSDTRVITPAELTNFTPWQLKVARNEIYARHGREFVHKDLQCYFKTKSWYTIDPNFSETTLSTTETKNVATIKAYEEQINSPLQSTDSGC